MDDGKMKEKVEDIKSKAKAFMKNFGSPFGASRGTQTFKGQGHRLGGSAEPSFVSLSPSGNPTPRTADASAPLNSSCSGGGCRGRKLGPGFNQQKQQQNDLRRLQQEKWERERGVIPAQTPRHVRDTVSSNSAHTRAAQTTLLQSGGTLASAAASVTSPTPDASVKVEVESRGTVEVGNLAPTYSTSAHSGHDNPLHFDPYSPIIASGTSHRPVMATSRNSEPQGQFQCPICQKWWQSEAQISAHIDDCSGIRNSELTSLAAGQKSGQGVHKGVEDFDDGVAVFLSGGPSNATITVILRVFRNVLNYPDEEKFRKLRLGNQKFKETVGSAIGGLKFLESVGFRSVVEGGEKMFLMDKPNSEQQERLQAAIAYLDSYYSAQTAPVASSLATNPAPSTPKAINRQLRIFYASKDHIEERFEPPESFYSLSGAELKNEAASRRKKLEDSQLLIPKSFKEKQAALARQRYKATVIRVQLPDGLVVQGFFRPGEPTSALYEFVASTLKDGHETFDLVLPAATKHKVIPRFPGASGCCPTLEEVDLVPKALVKFNPSGPHGYTCLKSECYDLCEPLTLMGLLEPEDLAKN